MKFIFILLSLLGFQILAFPQNGAKQEAFGSEYSRPTLSVFYMKFSGENHTNNLEQVFQNIILSEKYNNHNMGNMVLNVPFVRNPQSTNLSIGLRNYLLSKEIGKDIVSKWYNRKADGTMSVELILERGRYSATDADYLVNKATKRGETALMDKGYSLIKQSYILVLDFQGIQTLEEANASKDNKSVGYLSKVNAYLFKIKYDENIEKVIWDECWVYDEDTPDQKQEKIMRFNQLHIDIEPVMSLTKPFSASASRKREGISNMQQAMKEIMQSMAQHGLNEAIYKIETKTEELKVKSPVYEIKPIRAKIGRKEGVRCDQRYFVYEYLFNEKKNVITPKRRGVVRATQHIVDNRVNATGEMGTTRFYQTAGRKIETGYLLKQQNDLGLEIYGGAELGQVGGIYSRADIRLRAKPMQYGFFDFALQQKGYDLTAYSAPHDLYIFARFSLGFAKGYMLTRNLGFQYLWGIGIESCPKLLDHVFVKRGGNVYQKIDDDKKKHYSGPYSGFGKIGASLSLNIRHNIQVNAGVSYFYYPLKAFVVADKDKSGEDNSYVEVFFMQNGSPVKANWSKLFDGRKGFSPMISVKVGI